MLAKAAHKTYMKALKIAARIIPIPRPTLFTGADSAASLCEAIGLMNLGKLLIVTDKPLVEVGIVGKVERSLTHAGIEFVRYDGVLPDPTYLQAEEGLALYRQEQCMGVLAIGGGSPIDCAKVIAARVTNQKSIKRLAGLLKVWRTPAPLFAIPTTAGTGSEVTVAAVISEPKHHQKTPLMDPKLVPLMAALDPTLMTELPPSITAATGMDALTHAVEAYLSNNATTETDAYATAALKLIHGNLLAAYKDGKSLKVRLNMAMASYYAGLAFTKASLGYAHAIAHQLGAKYGTPHGVANALALPLVLDASLPSATSRMAKLALLTERGDRKWDDETNAKAFINYVVDLQIGLGISRTLPTIQTEDIPTLAKNAVRETHWNYPVPHYLTRTQCEQIFTQLKG
ncbi:iron-containing alcohol dehydrogenase [Enterovibrio paralichthyis]|uniref:iron-containing alcohol dehydrogenase n=1 Tax=Enterovibrio paralichthyis TaxID=2853805 RepID=UPI001C4369F5|nr:iron-containing alcohol dehydrogenase [Enterovibrio paralichthyis]MBV7298171.1 iron-containing alcohol dehydrogenase [Enterovibrio paralichthyis]